MRWNVEKGFFFICLGFLLLTMLGFAKTFILGDPLAGSDLSAPGSSDGGAVGGVVRIGGYEPVPIETARNPFQTVSDWRTAPEGPLGEPPLGVLPRRIPLPATVSDDPRARLRVESSPPVSQDEEESR